MVARLHDLRLVARALASWRGLLREHLWEMVAIYRVFFVVVAVVVSSDS